MPKVVHHQKVKEGECVYVGRPTKWGNPFSHLHQHTAAKWQVATREEAVESYRAWVLKQPELMAALDELKGKDLGCWCSPLACHADVLLELANKEAKNA